MMTTNLTKRINESICAVGIPVLRRHRAQVTKRPWKRALSSASLCASLTIEAALSLTLFMFTVILLSVPMEILDTQRKVQTVLEVTGRERTAIYITTDAIVDVTALIEVAAIFHASVSSAAGLPMIQSL